MKKKLIVALLALAMVAAYDTMAMAADDGQPGDTPGRRIIVY